MEKNLISEVSEQGLLIPKEWFMGVDKVEIIRKQDIITIRPVGKADPILQLGTEPTSCGIPDGSEAHDQYIYD